MPEPFTEIPVRQSKCRSAVAMILMSQVADQNGNGLTNAEMSGGSISYNCFDINSLTPRTPILTGTITPISSVLFDTLVTNDPRWTAGNEPGPTGLVGYNFRWIAPIGLTTLNQQGPGKRRIEILGTPATGPTFWFGAWEFTVAEMLSIY